MPAMPALDVDVKDIVLFPYCTMDETGIQDDLSDSFIPVNIVGRHMVELCDGMRTLGEVVDTITERFGVEPDRVRIDAIAFLESMERRGLVWIRRDRWRRMAPSALTHRALRLLSLNSIRLERRRYPATTLGLFFGAAAMATGPGRSAIALGPLEFVTIIRMKLESGSSVQVKPGLGLLVLWIVLLVYGAAVGLRRYRRVIRGPQG